MKRQTSYPRLWKPAHVLAAELSQWGTDANLVKTAASYMKQYPEASLAEWLERLVQLGQLFSSSDQTERYRQQLKAACDRLAESYPALKSGDEWAWVLGWAARLMPYYQGNRNAAERMSAVGRFVPQPVKPFQRPNAPVADELPEVREEVSDKAEDLFAKMQARWANKTDDD
ncbi:MAG: hypothetical protein KC433_03580 [Anaerolineales bacterium]|nr:hypothetical protein [Anaerolineales bacterium]MCB8937011.1 hypothetical protein [Ardenticatenaceae bacterium]